MIVSWEEVQRLFVHLSSSVDQFDKLTLVAVALMYFGLLRQGEVRIISIENVKMDDSNRRIHVEFTKRTKSRARGFGFTIPSLLYEPFKSYINELRPKVTGENFLKNWKASKKHPEGGARYQNMGKDQLTKMLDNICVFLGKPRDQVTGHIWRRSAAT